MSALPTTSPQRLAANRANAQLSTGPTSAEGKAKSSLNALKTGLTGKTVLLPSDDAAAYEEHLLRFLVDLQPVGERETELVQSLADTQWRLARIPGLESGMFAVGRKRYADLYEEETDGQVRAALLDAHTYMAEAKHFQNLHLQEARLHRQYQKDRDELRKLQAERQEKQEAETAKRQSSDKANGFEFSTPIKQQEQDRKQSVSQSAGPVQTSTAAG
jgi:hypothetical protein